MLGMVPMLIYLVVYIKWPPRFLLPMKKVVEENLKPMFSRCSIVQLLFIAFMAGFCEEIFFRWCLQGGLAHYIAGAPGTWVALAFASVVFGLCHWVNAAYGITTLVIGIFLGWMMIATNNWLVPAITHFVFDFVALYYIARIQKSP